MCAASGLVAQGARGAFKNAVPAGTLTALRERLQAEDEQRIGGRSSAGGAELLDPVPLRSTRSGLGPLDQHPRCLVAPLTSAHNYPATTLQRRPDLTSRIPCMLCRRGPKASARPHPDPILGQSEAEHGRVFGLEALEELSHISLGAANALHPLTARLWCGNAFV